VCIFVSHSRGRTQIRVFENRVQRKIFGPNRGEVAGGWRGLHNEELHNLYISRNFSMMKQDEMVGM
jgi:hypothetical protein